MSTWKTNMAKENSGVEFRLKKKSKTKISFGRDKTWKFDEWTG